MKSEDANAHTHIHTHIAMWIREKDINRPRTKLEMAKSLCDMHDGRKPMTPMRGWQKTTLYTMFILYRDSLMYVMFDGYNHQ